MTRSLVFFSSFHSLTPSVVRFTVIIQEQLKKLRVGKAKTTQNEEDESDEENDDEEADKMAARIIAEQQLDSRLRF
jgi:hypothetical protein